MASEELNISVVENPRQSGSRRKLKSNEEKKKKQKQAQRGMGVEKLERERLGLNGQKTPLLPSHYFLPAPYPDPSTAIIGGYGQLGLDQALFLRSLGYVGLGGESTHGLGSEQVRVGPYGFGAGMDMGLRSGSYLGENSKELSSIPNPVRYPSDQCGLCHKKKRLNDGSLGDCNAMREKYVDPYLINGCSFNGFNVANRQNIHGINVDKGSVEVVGVHKKGAPRAFMEYEFFPPGKGGRSTSTNDLDLSLFSEASVAAALLGGGGGEGSCVTTTTTTTASPSTCFDASTSIDLSLKLSY
ncbi:hypothetical protein Vadar_000593 [Vaccinium darrowii]|uniref:Uncharacterized protein n=1 Tax=Vaccinium darrowii TaxID=229202 RepID=A0ACB7XMM1_9ERIC|nr:hypothetical protein Vadar_000593 [Vaccinium darrowii]